MSTYRLLYINGMCSYTSLCNHLYKGTKFSGVINLVVLVFLFFFAKFSAR